ncbi:ATP-binding protein [Marinicella rhabdoformis]|uniref:ATP-binding protein n=1 Tax=Marinicella rhabdoformis TaxID=2580566 RepID=UPI0015D0219E|nr:ATP-binding protein [Marinicella rhabdoformis]
MKKVTLLVCLLLFYGATLAQTDHSRYVNVKRLDIYSGLAGNKVTQIGQDETGFLWLASHNGLSRFDGRKFNLYQQSDQLANALANNQISLFKEAKQGLWLALNNVGLSYYDYQTSDFTLFPVDESQTPQALMNNIVFAIETDTDGDVWVFQFEQGVSVWNQDQKSFTHYTQENVDWLPSVRFFDAKRDADGNIWVATLDGLILVIDPDAKTAIVHDISFDENQPQTGRVYGLSISQDGSVYAAAYNGLHHWSPDTEKFDLVVFQEHIKLVMGAAEPVRHVLADSMGRVWLSTRKGLMLLEEKQLTRMAFLERGQAIPQDIHVRSVFEDKEHQLWVATDEQGVFKIANQWQQMTIHLPFNDAAQNGNNLAAVLVDHGRSEDLIFALNDKRQEMWLGRYQRGQINHVRSYGAAQQLPQQINASYLDSQFRLWLATADGLYFLNQAKDQFESFPLPEEASAITGLFEINGKLWVAVYGDTRFYQIDQSNQQVSPVVSTHSINKVLHGIKKMASGDYWLFGDVGLQAINATGANSRTLLTVQTGISDVIESSDGELVLVLSNGRVKSYQYQDQQLILNQDNVLGGDYSQLFAKKMIEDGQGRLWLSSDNGLIIKSEDGIQHLTVKDGLPSNLIVDVIVMHDGKNMVVTKAGLVQVQYNPESPVAVTPELRINHIQLNDEFVSSVFELPHQYGALSLDYQLMSFIDPESHEFEYRLHNSESWQKATGQQLTFYQLPAGSYQLQLRGKSQNSDWSKSIVVPFVVNKAPWQTQSAYLLYAVIAALLLLMLVWLLRKRWQYQSSLAAAKEKQAFAQAQLSLSSSVIGALEMDALLEKIKSWVSEKIPQADVEVAYWNSETQYEVFSHVAISKKDKLDLGSQAFAMFKDGDETVLRTHPKGHELLAGFHLSENRLGLIQIIKATPFKDNQVLLAQAFASQLAMALENARLFSEVNSLAEQSQAASQAKSNFLAQVSHEVRTPMNGILGMNQLLMDSELTATQRAYTEAVAESGQHLLHIINDILDFSKIEAGQLSLEYRAFDLTLLIDELLGLFRAMAKHKGLLFYLDVDPELCASRMGDSVRLKQVVMNLLSNAFKFTQEGCVKLQVNQDNQYVVFSVSDTGPGIAADQLDKLFEPFIQADTTITRTHGGTGLGLSIVKQLCELMGGYVSINSELGAGSTFSCYLPFPPGETIRTAEDNKNINQVTLLSDNSALAAALVAQCELIGGKIKIFPFSDVQAQTDKTEQVVMLLTEPVDDELLNSIEVLCQNGKQLTVIKAANVPFYLNHQNINILNFPVKCAELSQLWEHKDPAVSHVADQVETEPKSILVLEDNAINQELMRHLLQQAGHTVHMFDHALDALAVLNEGLDCDLMLVDYHLPDVSGIEFINQARLLLPTVPCAILTADVSDQLLTLCHQHRIDDVFTKPIDISAIQHMVSLC